VRLPEFRLFNGESLIDEDASFSERLSHGGYEGSVQIVKNEDAAVGLLGQWIGSLPFKVNLPYSDRDTIFSRESPGPVEGISGSVAANHRQVLFAGQKNPVVTIATGHV